MELVMENLSSENSVNSKLNVLRSVETYYGYIPTLYDAIIIIEAVKKNLLGQRLTRLSSKEHKLIRSGTVFVWEETISQICRWTDGRSWSASRLQDDFLVYQELPLKTKKKTNSPYDKILFQSKVMDNCGLIKKSISLTDKEKRYHLINYYSLQDVSSNKLEIPSENPIFSSLDINHFSYCKYNGSPQSTSQIKSHENKSIKPSYSDSSGEVKKLCLLGKTDTDVETKLLSSKKFDTPFSQSNFITPQIIRFKDPNAKESSLQHHEIGPEDSASLSLPTISSITHNITYTTLQSNFYTSEDQRIIDILNKSFS